MGKEKGLSLGDLIANYTTDEGQVKDDLAEVAPALNPKLSGASLQDLLKEPKSEKRDQAVKSVRGFRSDVQSIKSGLNAASQGNPELRKQFDAIKADPVNKLPVEKGFVRKVAEFVDTPHRALVRTPIAKVAGLPEGSAQESGTFHEELRKKFGQDTFHIPGNPLPKGFGRDFVDDLVFDTVTDPLSFVGGVSKGAAVMKNAEKLLGPGHQALGQIQNVLKTTGGMESFQKAKQIFEAAGVPTEKILQIFGKNGEFFGRSTIGLKNELAGSLLKATGAKKAGEALKEGVPLLSSYPEAKALQWAATPATNLLGAMSTKAGREGLDKAGVLKEAFLPVEPRRKLFDLLQRKNEMESLSRSARATESETKRAFLEQAVPLKQFADRLDPKRLEEILRFHVDPHSAGQYAAVKLAPEEQKFVTGLQDLFKQHEPFIQSLGVPLAKNKISGHYYPRVYDKAGQGTDILQALFAGNPARNSKGIPTGAKIFRPREADIALGNPGAPPATLDPGKVLAGYARQISAAKGYKELEGGLAKQFSTASGQLEPEAQRFLAGQYDQYHRQLERQLKQLKGEEGPVEAYAQKGLGLYDKASAWWKKWTTQHFPGYHIGNKVGDLGLMFQGGIDNPKAWLNRADELIAAAQKGDPAAAAALKEAQSFGIGHGALDRSGGLTGFADDLAELEKMAGSHHAGPSGLLDKLPAWMQMNSKAAEGWDLRSRLAAYLHGKEGLGLSARDAADRQFQILLDYGKRSGSDWLVKRLFPFTAWQTQAPVAGVKGILQNPGRFNAVTHAVSDLGAGEKKHGVPPAYAEDKSLYARVPDFGRALFDKAATALGAERVLGDLQVPVRYGPQEAISPISAVEGSGEPGSVIRGILGQGNPFLKFAAQEVLSQMKDKPDLMTGRKSTRAFEGQGTKGTLGRLGLEVLTPRIAQPLVNAVSREVGGPANLAGRYKENAPDKRGRTLKDILAIAGFRPIETDASSTLNNIRDSEAFQELKNKLPEMKKKAAEKRKKAKK